MLFRRTSVIASSFALTGVGFVAGCAPWATYPPVEHTSKLVNPTFEPMPTLMAETVRYAHEHYGTVSDATFNLPAGMSYKVYDKVIAKLGFGRPMEPGDELAYHITAVRTRGPEAEVDVIVPRADGVYELVTVRFKEKIGKGPTIASAREWRVHAEPPAANYLAPPASDVANAEHTGSQSH